MAQRKEILPTTKLDENLPRQDLLQFIRLTTIFAGMHPFTLSDRLPSLLRFIVMFIDFCYEIFMYFVTIHIGTLYACTLYLFYHDGDLEFLVNCLLQLIIYTWTIAMKIYFRRIRGGLLADIMNLLNSEYKTRSAKGHTFVTMDETLATSNSWILTYVVCCFGGTAFWAILPIAYGDRSLPLACWYPFDYKLPKVYEAMYFLQVLAQLQVAAAFSASSGFHMVLAILISGQYDVLYCSLKNIIATAYLKSGTKREEFIKLEQELQQDNEIDELNQYYSAKERRDDFECTSIEAAAPQTFVYGFKKAFRSCINHHKYILKLLKKMEQFFSFIWLLKTGEVIFLMCLVAFVSVKSTSANSFMKIISLVQYLILIIWELLIICYFGEMILQNSQRCDEAILRSPWYLHMQEMKQDFLFFLMNSQRAFKLTAGKMYDIDINRFRAVITTAFSFLTILQKMDQRG